MLLTLPTLAGSNQPICIMKDLQNIELLKIWLSAEIVVDHERQKYQEGWI